MPKGFSRWDPAEGFRTDEEALLFVQEVAKDGSADEIRSAIASVARYLGVRELARRTRMSHKRILAEINSLDDEPTTLATLMKRLGIMMEAGGALPGEIVRDAAE